MQITDELRVLVEAEVARAIENFKKLSEGVDDSEKKTLSLGEALDSLSKKSLIISGVFGGAGIAAVKFAGENEKLKLSLKNMLGSAQEASIVFEEWRQLGNSPGLSTDEVLSLGRAMIHTGNSAEYATQTMQMLGNVAAGTGLSFGEISSSFERARAMGNLTTRDLVRLQQQGIPIVKQLAKEMNTSEENIRRLAAEGKIGFSDLEKAFKSMTGPGGQFAGMMDELSGTALEKFGSAVSDAKHALASFGELLLPMATELLGSASSILHGITNMDEGTKRFVLGMGGVIAVSGPAIAAIKGIGSAMTFVAANPFVLAIGGVVAAASIAVGLINKQANAYTDFNTQLHKNRTEADLLLRSYADGNNAKLIDAETTDKLIKLYPQLSGEITAYSSTVDDATNAVKRLTEAEVINAANKRIEILRRQAEAAENAAKAYEQYTAKGIENIELARRMGDEFNARKFEEAIETYKYGWDEAAAKAENTRRQINAELAKIGKGLGDDFDIIDIPVVITMDRTALELLPAPEIKKSWQEWFGEITKVDPALFGNSGSKAAELYLAEFERSLTAQQTITTTLGEQLDLSGILRRQQSDVHNALIELFTIDPSQINMPFSLADESVQRLIESYRRLGDEAKEAENALLITDTLSNLSREVQNLTEDKYDLAMATLVAAGATEEEIRQAAKMIETLREASQAVNDLSISFNTFLSQKVADGLKDIFTELEEQTAEAIGNITAQLAAVSFDSMLSGLNAVGEAFGRGEASAENFRQIIADMAMQILNQLPMMFLQAGLQLIAQGQWPLGLGFVAAAGSSALIAGYTNGRIEKEREAMANAHGNIYGSSNLIPFAAGGAFTNQIVNQPTYFRFGGSLGVMGEAGPEAIMPLKRMPSGNLGVESDGGSNTFVYVNIINNSGENVRKEESTDENGNKQIDVVIGSLVNSHITSGKADRAMERFGVRPMGV